MLSRFGIYKNLIFLILISAFVCVPAFSAEIKDLSERDIMETAIDEDKAGANTDYINDIEILGANIIKPDYILQQIYM